MPPPSGVSGTERSSHHPALSLVSPAEKVRMSKDSESEDIGARREGIRTDRRDLPTAGRRLCCEEKTTRITPVPRFGQEF